MGGVPIPIPAIVGGAETVVIVISEPIGFMSDVRLPPSPATNV
jgi:hypothetical protein